MTQTKLLKDFLSTVRDVHATSGGTQETFFTVPKLMTILLDCLLNGERAGLSVALERFNLAAD